MMQGITSLPGAQPPQAPQGMPQGAPPGMPQGAPPGAMPQPPQQPQTPAGMTGQLEKLPPQQLLAMFGNPMDKTPKWAVVSAYAKAIENQRMMDAARNQSVVQQAQAQQGQMPVAAEVMSQPLGPSEPVMARNGGIMSGYAGGGAVAFDSGGSSLPDQETVDFLNRIYGQAYGPRQSFSLEEIEEAYRKAGLRGPRNSLADISDVADIGGGGYASSRVRIPVSRPPAAPQQDDGVLDSILKERVARQAGLEALLQKQGQVDPELQRLREAQDKGQQGRISARDVRSLEEVKRAQEASTAPLMDNQEALLRMAGAGGGAKRAGELFSNWAKEAGTVRGEQRKTLEKAQERRAQEQNALDVLNNALEEKRVADKSGDVAAKRAAELKVEEARAQLLEARKDTYKLKQDIGFKGREVAAAEEKARAATLQAGTSAAALNRPERETDLRLAANIEFRALLAKGEPDNAITRQKAFDTAARKLSKGASMSRAETAQLVAANKEFAEEMLLGTEGRRIRAIKDPAAKAAATEELRTKLETKYGVRPDIENPLAREAPRTAAAPTAVPAAKPGMPEPPKGYVPD